MMMLIMMIIISSKLYNAKAPHNYYDKEGAKSFGVTTVKL